jgi:hypothetical protein
LRQGDFLRGAKLAPRLLALASTIAHQLFGAARHIAAAFGAIAAGQCAFLHVLQLLATFRTGVANLGADSADLLAERGIAQHEICRCLTYFGAAHHQPKMPGLDMLAARFQAMTHGGLQTGLMAADALVNA